MALTPRKDLTTATAVEYTDGATVITADNLNKQQRTILYNSQQIDELATGKQNAESGKGLSTNDYTTAEKQKLAAIEAGATKTVIDTELSDTSTNPVQNKAVKEKLDELSETADAANDLALAAYPTDTASGEVVSFPDGADNVPVKKLVVNIEPYQEGDGDPSPENVRPIHGWTELHTVRSADFDKNGAAGVEVDFEAKTFKRLDNAAGLSAGADFDGFIPFGGRRRCTVLDNGEITAFYGDDGYVEDGSNGQVMVYQPKFYYKVVPVKLEAQTDGVGYHIRKAEYYVSATAKEGFKLHPAFKDVNGNEVDYILLPAYEGCLYDVSAGAYITDDAQVGDFTATTGDKLSSIAGVKPASGSTRNLTRPNVEILAQNRGANWHGYTIQAASANQMLMLIELAGNVQSAIGQGVVSYTSGSGNEASNTGSTSSLGNKSGQATQTTHIASDGTTTTDTTAGKLSVSYRGMENPWGNIWDFVYGINIHGNGNQKGGIPYICTDFNFAESKNSGNYESASFTATNANGYISAFGYGNPDYDWLFIASETTRTSALPIGDYTYITANLDGYKIARLGGNWDVGAYAGAFYWVLDAGVSGRGRYIGGRLVYVPTADGTTQPLDEWKKNTKTKIYPIIFPSEAGTVYGGTLDVTTGVLTVDRAIVTLDGTQTLNASSFSGTANSAIGRFVLTQPAADHSDITVPNIVCDTLKTVECYRAGAFAAWKNDSTATNAITTSTNGDYIAIALADTSITKNDELLSRLASEPITAIYTLATPIVYQLTPQEVKTLLGVNNIFADTGDVEVEYRADTKLYIDKQIAELQALVLENNG